MKNSKRLVDEELISLGELARRWKCSRQTVRRRLREGGVRGFLFGASRNATLRYSVREVEVFLRSCRS